MFNYTASTADALAGVATNSALSPATMYAAYGRSAPVTVASTSTLSSVNNIVVATASGITLTLPLTNTYGAAQLNTNQVVVANYSGGSITVQGQSQFPSTAFSITGSTTSGSTYSLDATHLPTVVGGSIATNLFTATADNASAQSFDNVVGSGITALTPQMVLTPGSIFTVDGTSTNTSLVLLNPTSGLLSNGSKIWCDDGGTMKNITAGNVVATTQDNSGAAWVQQTLPVNANWSSVAYGNGTFVAVSDTNSNVAATSVDGVTWVQRTLPVTSDWAAIAYGNGVFVTVSFNTSIAATSSDGVNWTQQVLPFVANWCSIAYGNGIFVAITGRNSNFGTSALASTVDGVTWVFHSLPATIDWRSITYGSGLFLAVGAGVGSATTIYATSTNGATWTQRTLPTAAYWCSVTYGNGLFAAVSGSGVVSNVAATSTDGINWVQRTLPSSSGTWFSVAYGNGLFAALGWESPSSKVATSIDGINWTPKIIPSIANYGNISSGGGIFVIVSIGTTAITSNAGYFRKYTCTALSPSLSNVPAWVAKGGQVLAGSISTTSTPNFSAVVPTTYTATRATNTLTITTNQLSGFTSGTHVQLKAQTLSNGDVMSALNAISNSQGINGGATYTLPANSAVSLIPTSTVGWLIG